MSSRNTIYTGAAYKLKQRKVLTTSTDPLRYAFDDNYNQTLTFMLERAGWNFAMRSVKLEPDVNVTPQFGFSASFAVPSDFVRLIKISATEQMFPPLAAGEFSYESAGASGMFWNANLSLLYVSYVSNDTNYGASLGNWTETFATAFEYELADRCAGQITNMSTADWEVFHKNRKRALAEAKSKDAYDQSLDLLAPGTLTRARMGARGTWLWRS